MYILKTIDLREGFEGRVFFVTDIHGSFHLLEEKLKEVEFDEQKDLLIVGGDNCDRGTHNRKIIDYMNEHWYHSIIGNHELLFMRTFEGDKEWKDCFLRNGGAWYLSLFEDEKRSIYDYFGSLPLTIEVKLPNGKDIGFIHSQVPYDNWDVLRTDEQNNLPFNPDGKYIETAVWSRDVWEKYHDIKNPPYKVEGIDKVYVGHTVVKIDGYNSPKRIGNVVYCDGGACFKDGELFIVRVY